MAIVVLPSVRFTYIRACLFQFCENVQDVWRAFGVETPVLTGAGPDEFYDYADESDHREGWAFDFRVKDLPPDQVVNAYLRVRYTITLDFDLGTCRILLFYQGNVHDGPIVKVDTHHRPDHLHVAYHGGR